MMTKVAMDALERYECHPQEQKGDSPMMRRRILITLLFSSLSLLVLLPEHGVQASNLRAQQAAQTVTLRFATYTLIHGRRSSPS